MAGTPPIPLLVRIARGEADAVRACVDEFGPTIHAVARRYLVPVKGDVEGAVQEVFIELWRNAGKFDPGRGSEAAFVMTLAHRRLIDKRRWYASRFSVAEGAGEAEQGVEGGRDGSGQISGQASAQARAEHREEARAIGAALDQLPADEQRVLRLSIYNGLSHERIAVAIGAPVGTVKTRIRRGLERLRAQVAGAQGLWSEDAKPLASGGLAEPGARP